MSSVPLPRPTPNLLPEGLPHPPKTNVLLGVSVALHDAARAV